MTNKEMITRDIGLTFDLIRKVIKDPDLADKIPQNSFIEFVEKDFEFKKRDFPENVKLISVKNEIQL